jgi:putative endonuclease
VSVFQDSKTVTAWALYVLRTREGHLYTGIATDVRRRIEEHAGGRGAKALRGRGPLELVYRKRIGEHGLALRLEHRLKLVPKRRKEAIVRAQPTRAKLLALLLPDPAGDGRGS